MKIRAARRVYILDTAIIMQTSLRPSRNIVTRWGALDHKGELIIPTGYAWDGCSPKLRVGRFLVLGTPDGAVDDKTDKPAMYYRSLKHDWCTQHARSLEWADLSRTDADKELISDEAGHTGCNRNAPLPWWVRKTYFRAVRLFGWWAWNKAKKAVPSDV